MFCHKDTKTPSCTLVSWCPGGLVAKKEVKNEESDYEA